MKKQDEIQIAQSIISQFQCLYKHLVMDKSKEQTKYSIQGNLIGLGRDDIKGIEKMSTDDFLWNMYKNMRSLESDLEFDIHHPDYAPVNITPLLLKIISQWKMDIDIKRQSYDKSK